MWSTWQIMTTWWADKVQRLTKSKPIFSVATGILNATTQITRRIRKDEGRRSGTFFKDNIVAPIWPRPRLRFCHHLNMRAACTVLWSAMPQALPCPGPCVPGAPEGAALPENFQRTSWELPENFGARVQVPAHGDVSFLKLSGAPAHTDLYTEWWCQRFDPWVSFLIWPMETKLFPWLYTVQYIIQAGYLPFTTTFKHVWAMCNSHTQQTPVLVTLGRNTTKHTGKLIGKNQRIIFSWAWF